MWGVFAEMERNIISQRVKSGMKNAAAKGKKIGRPETTADSLPDRFWKYYKQYYNGQIRSAYKEVEAAAEDRLLERLPGDLRPVYEEIFRGRKEDGEEEAYMRRLVKAADKLSALIKCIEEENAGNREFRTAKLSTEKTLEKMAGELPEVRIFMEEFLPPYGSTLDELA